MPITEIFDTEFDLGATSTEPTIRRIIEAYYVDRGIDIARAKELTNELITVALAKVGS